MFLGEYAHTLDAKGRLIFPAKFRKALGSEVVIQKGIERCMIVYTPGEWDKAHRRVSALPTGSAKARSFRRFFFSQASSEEFDKSGRLTIPTGFREWASLEREVVVVGNGQTVEVWDRAKWDESRRSVEDNVDEISSELDI